MQDCGCAWEGLPVKEYLFTDASSFGYGAHLSSLMPGALASGVCQPKDALHHMTFKELCSAKLAFYALAPALVHCNVAIFSNSASTVAILRNLNMHSCRLRGTLDGIIHLMVRLGVRLTPHNISGELNVLAD